MIEQTVIYTDVCDSETERRILEELKRDVVYRLPDKNWNVNDTLGVIADPRIELAVINNIDEISIMEIALLHMLCKPILLTARASTEYKILGRTVDHIDVGANLRHSSNNFIKWYKLWKDIE